MNKIAKLVVGAAATLALAGGVGAGIAAADPTPTPTPTPAAKPTTGTGQTGAKHRGLLARGLHGQVTLAGKQHRVVDFQRGTVQKVSATSLTVRSKDGFTATYVLDARTKVREGKTLGSLKDIAAKDKVRVVGVKHGHSVTAKVVREPK